MKKRTGQTAYISGGSSGIGKAIARVFMQKGINVVILARREELLSKTVQELQRENHAARAHTISVDISQKDILEKRLREAFQVWGKPDYLINSAGVPNCQNFEDIGNDKLEQIFSINMLGTWNLTKICLKYMDRGYIVNISSLAGLIGIFGYTAYGASKAAIVGFSQALRNELSIRGIKVMCLCPSDVDTPQLAEENKTRPPEQVKISKMTRVLEAKQVANYLWRKLHKRYTFLIIPGFFNRLVWFSYCNLPRFVHMLIDNDVRLVNKNK